MMHAPTVPADCPTSIPSLQTRYLAILPFVEKYAPFAASGLKCPDRRAELAQEMRAVVWAWLVRLARQGKDASAFSASLAFLAARAVRAGRKLTGSDSTQDVLSPRAQAHHRFTVAQLTENPTLRGTVWEEALADNRHTPPDEAACFRLDWPCWLAGWDERDRRLIEDLAIGERTGDLARKYGVSASRVSQKRHQFHEDWQRFQGEDTNPDGQLPECRRKRA
jgi:hypothetical protein